VRRLKAFASTMDGSQGYEPRVYYTPTMGYDAGSSARTVPTDVKFSDISYVHNTALSLRSQSTHRLTRAAPECTFDHLTHCHTSEPRRHGGARAQAGRRG